MEAAQQQTKRTPEEEAAARVAAPPTPEEATSYFDFELHEKVQEFHKKGIWTDLGPRWGGLKPRLRPFHVKAVVVRRETVEQAVRIKLGLTEDDPIPAAEGIAINRSAVVMALTGCKGRILAPTTARYDEAGDELPSLADVAKDAGLKLIKVDAKTVVEFSGQEEPEAVRKFFAPMIETSMPLLTTLVRASRALQRVKDEEIGRLGEDYIYGAPAQEGWAD